ncbi:hypothetical protein CLV98_11593 [Dyadobacter jejuensis]|uniref:Uncharacterized protein n=1 Tax=Dyadobacter jejuensis TaxID=1082580 RepID=A0A316ABW4_9BACT|nr:hypothetical protein [Dyadobacter jejuensis]PWJ55072.1 hypothetical protein CLV98_11593 [Dyadobacter jejuensis]
MSPIQTLFTVITLLITGEAIAEFMANHSNLLLVLAIMAFSILFIVSVFKANSKKP